MHIKHSLHVHNQNKQTHHETHITTKDLMWFTPNWATSTMTGFLFIHSYSSLHSCALHSYNDFSKNPNLPKSFYVAVHTYLSIDLQLRIILHNSTKFLILSIYQLTTTHPLSSLTSLTTSTQKPITYL
jgi:hypothetical protein